jgi:predicted GIY-YIG superfamily endonuclease
MSHDQDPWASTGSSPQDEPSIPPGTPAAGRAGSDQALQAHAGDRGTAGQEQSDPGQPGTCYLLHFSEPYQHARHYSRTAADLQARLAEHKAGRGSRLLQVAKAGGITWTLARTWPGGRTRERQLKNQGGASRRCPECGVTPRTSPAERKDTTGVKQPSDRDPGPGPGTRPPEYVAELWVSHQLKDKIHHFDPTPDAAKVARQIRSPEPELEAEP